MIRTIIILALVAALFVTALPAAAQAPDECEWTPVVEAMIGTALPGLLDGSYSESEIGTRLIVMAKMILVTDAVCHGLQFEGDGQQVIGPLWLEPGAYIVQYAGEAQTDRDYLLQIRLSNVTADDYDSINAHVSGQYEGSAMIRIRRAGEWYAEVDGQRVTDWQITIVPPRL